MFPDHHQLARTPETQKVVRLVDYLLGIAALRRQTIRNIANYEKVLWVSEVPHEQDCFTQAWGRDEERDEWLEVKHRREPELPAVPPPCNDWVNRSELRNKTSVPALRREITRQTPNPNWQEGAEEPENIPRIERLGDHPEIQQAWDRFVEDKWLPWREDHNAWERLHEVYSTLFAIDQSQRRLGEEYELVLGLGLLTWQTPTAQCVRRHLVVADAILEFDARLSKFTVRPHTDGAKVRIELDMLSIEEQPARTEETAKASLARAEDDPWEKACIVAVLQALVHSINPQGVYDDSLAAANTRATAKPTAEFAPALILRKRSAKGLTETLNRIKDKVETGEADIPATFADLAEIRLDDRPDFPDPPEDVNAPFDGEVFFPKPSNDEQRRIVQMIYRGSGVVVQGPPGTGKSHTIANLICHLLATGKRTLITAKTPRALQVLHTLLPDALRPLCINLLGSGLEERRSLESSVGGILRKTDDWNEDRAARERTEQEQRLRQLREEYATVTRRLRDIRESETHLQFVADGAYRGTAARIAEAVSRDQASYNWFTDSISLDKPPQVSPDDVRTLLSELRHFTPERRKELAFACPEEVPSNEHFANLITIETDAAQEEECATPGSSEQIADLLARSNSSTISTIRDRVATFLNARKRLLALPQVWMNDALRDILCGNSSQWNERLRVTQDVIASIEQLVTVADTTAIEFPDTADISGLLDDARKLNEHMKTGGTLGWSIFRPKVVKERRYIIDSVKVRGRRCSTIEHFSTLSDVLHVRIECEKAWSFWGGWCEKAQGPYALQLTALKSLRDALENALALEELIAKSRVAISQCSGMDEPVWADESQIEKIASSCRLALARYHKRCAAEELRLVETAISCMAAKDGAHPVIIDLLIAIRTRDLGRFAECMNTIQELVKQRQRLQEVDGRLAQLRRLLPELTNSLEQTCDASHWDERVEYIGEAWHWAQARCWVEGYIRQEDVPALAQRSRQIEDEISDILANLAALHAWSFCVSRLNEGKRRHMEAWQQSMRRLGKGDGKHAPHHRREAQGHLNECREAVPAWVMPLHRVWDTVDPAPGMFDVIIVDEASQCGVDALPLFFLGKTILIVGDDKQISPDAVGVPREAVHRLMEEFLGDFHFKSSFDIESSLFDHGKLRYGTRRITLREHFRCMPEIIRFSNDLCYSDTPLIPLRQYGPNRLPPLEHVFVRGGYREGEPSRAINRPEADAIAKRIGQMCRDRRYDDKTMGVVVLQGEAQAELIEKQLLEQLGAEEMERRRLVCGNPYNFQGDERDIILLSLVAASNKQIGSLTKSADERRFNVAASRARDMMILFHSVTCNDLGVSCLRRRLLEFFQDTKPQQIAGIERNELERRAAQDNRRVVKPPAPFESWFELDVALELLRRDFTVLAQHEVAGKRLDLVVEGGQARLAVECDGDHWHGADRFEDDMQRQRQLERCRWEFYRVRESAFYANKEDALAGLWRMLEERSIFPKTQPVSQPHQIDVEEQEGGFEFEVVANNDGVDDDEDGSSDDSEDLFELSGRRVEEITAAEIEGAILRALSKCPNHSCTLHSLTARVLREVGVLTRGKPREAFEKRTMRCVGTLEKNGRIETYKAKNRRLRLVNNLFT